MSWPCPVCQKDFSRRDNLQRHMNSKHSDSNFAQISVMRSFCKQVHDPIIFPGFNHLVVN